MQTDLESWNDDGVLILRGLFDPEQLALVNEAIDKLWRDRASLTEDIVIDTFLETEHYARQLFKLASDESRWQPYKLNDLYLSVPVIRSVILNSVLCEHLATLLEGAPLAFNSLNFEYGSQQSYHRDTLFMPPRVPDKMAVSWIALEDISPDSGPVSYYPGSHKIPAFRFSSGEQHAIPEEMKNFETTMTEAVAALELKPVSFEADCGDVLIWHSELLHGGTPIHDKTRSRKSLVTHYYRKEDYIHQSSLIKEQHPNGYYLNKANLQVDATQTAE